MESDGRVSERVYCAGQFVKLIGHPALQKNIGRKGSYLQCSNFFAHFVVVFS
jgi:hypothetical protein